MHPGPVAVTRSFAHWTARYVWDRVTLEVWLRRHPDQPWLTPESVRLLDGLLRTSDRVFEWGSGRSTRWFAERAAAVTSIETNPVWHATVQESLRDFPNSVCVLRPVGNDPATKEIESYCSALGSIEPGPVDVVVVDGVLRDLCAIRATDFLVPGGLLVVDDIERYVPSDSRSPDNARGFASETWRSFADLVSTWRLIWTSSGVHDTAIWIRPG